MLPRLIQFVMYGVAVVCVLSTAAWAEDGPFDLSRPACGKVCKLVCDTKILVAIGYGNECKEICVPGPSRSGYKHCAICCGECQCDPCTCCQGSAPKCEFCWRDWFACGCATPRSVKVLTKYQAEKKICRYHWEVVDASCCDCMGFNGEPNSHLGIAHAPGSQSFYKPAPENAQIGAVLPLSDEDWVKLAAVLRPDPRETTEQVAVDAAPGSAANEAQSESDAVPSKTGAESASVAERLQRIFTR